MIKTEVGIADWMRNSDGDDCNANGDVGELLQQLKTSLLDRSTRVDGVVDEKD